MARKVLYFISHWGTREPLFDALVVPAVELLLDRAVVDEVRLYVLDPEAGPVARLSERRGVEVRPLRSVNMGWKPLSRAITLFQACFRLTRDARKERPLLLLGRGSIAGGFAWFVSKWSGIPFAVDLFEPHAEYMVECGEWSGSGVLARSLRWSMRVQARDAIGLVTVTHRYADHLREQGVDGTKLAVAPCPVPDMGFFEAREARLETRAKLGYEKKLVGVYMGKFGGLYHREKAFEAFERTRRFFGDRFSLLILSGDDHAGIAQGLRQAGFPGSCVRIEKVAHNEVPDLLGACDFAFGLYRGTASSMGISPMKIAEYWAAGLPVLLTRGIGDDSAIIEREPYGGAVFDPERADLTVALESIIRTLGSPEQVPRTQAMARKYRSMEHTHNALVDLMAAAARFR